MTRAHSTKSRALTAARVAPIALVIGCGGCSQASDLQGREGPWEGVEREITRFREEHEVPGIAVVVLKDGEVAFQRGYGWANRERQTPVTATTIFPIGSIEKQFTAAAVMRLVEEGKLRLDDPITDYLADP